MIDVNITIEDKEVRSLVNRLTALPQKTTEWLKSVAAVRMRESFEKNFEAEGRPNKWAELSGGTATIRKIGRELGWWSVGDTNPILRRTGDLMKMVISTEEEISGDGGELIMKMDPSDMMSKFSGSKRGGADSYLEHQLGIEVKQRQMVLFQGEDIEWLSSRYSDFIDSVIQK